MVLDLMLPDMDGLEVCRRLRGTFSEVPVLMLTARGDAMDRVVGLEVGADDYLRQAVRAARAAGAPARDAAAAAIAPGPPACCASGGSRSIADARRVRVDGTRATALTGHQFALLVALAERAGRVLSRETR